MNVSEVRVGVLDAAGTPIEVVYVKNAPSYAIYGTHQRVMVHLADGAAERATQQELLATLNPLRNEINALIDGWRTNPAPDKEALTRLFDRRIADALALAFEGDPVSAKALLKSTLDEIAEERRSLGRIEHLLFAGATAAGIAVLTFFILLIGGAESANFLDNHVNALLFAAAVGAIGALVSIGIAIQERRLSTDLQTRDNITDAVLRVAVGSVGALLLIAMIRADLINVDMRGETVVQQGPTAIARTEPPRTGTTTATAPVVAPAASAASPTAAPATGAAPAPSPVPAAAAVPAPAPAVAPAVRTGADLTGNSTLVIGKNRTTELLVMLVIAFFAGFTERLVGRLAERMQFREVAAGLPQPGSADGGASTRGQGGGGADRGNGPGPSDGRSEMWDQSAAEEEHVDGCIADVELAAEDLTDDSELPETTGGVAEESRT